MYPLTSDNSIDNNSDSEGMSNMNKIQTGLSTVCNLQFCARLIITMNGCVTLCVLNIFTCISNLNSEDTCSLNSVMILPEDSFTREICGKTNVHISTLKIKFDWVKHHSP